MVRIIPFELQFSCKGAKDNTTCLELYYQQYSHILLSTALILSYLYCHDNEGKVSRNLEGNIDTHSEEIYLNLKIMDYHSGIYPIQKMNKTSDQTYSFPLILFYQQII